MATLHKIVIKDVMVKELITIGLEAPFSQVWEIFSMHRIRHLPVVDQDKKLKGLVTQRDFYRIVPSRCEVEDRGSFYLKETLDKFILQKVMIKDVLTLLPEDTLGKAIDVMVKKKYGCIPIVDQKGILAGILTQTDALRAIAQYFL
ncbi:MAG TPA: CBS domain-containing protein [Candidatus Omnitrophota bacterium]|nr:CBS domain-containing protein [Candidatus Omnitrophota bacterium]